MELTIDTKIYYKLTCNETEINLLLKSLRYMIADNQYNQIQTEKITHERQMLDNMIKEFEKTRD